MVTYTTTDLIDAIKRTAHVSQGNSTFDTNGFLALADTEMRTGVSPKIASTRENYWLTDALFSIASNNKYAIPSLALGGAFVDLKIKTSESFLPVTRIEVSDLFSTQSTDRFTYAYYLQDGVVRIVPESWNGQLIMWYYRIPSKLVPVASCAQVASVAGAVVEVTTMPSGLVNGGELDIVSQNPGFNVLLKDSTPVSIVGTTITFEEEVPSDIKVGDYVCLSGQSCVVQAPLEWIEVLVQRVAMRIYEIQGYLKKYEVALITLKAMEQAAMSAVSPRTIESPKIITGGGSLLTTGQGLWRRFYGGSNG